MISNTPSLTITLSKSTVAGVASVRLSSTASVRSTASTLVSAAAGSAASSSDVLLLFLVTATGSALTVRVRRLGLADSASASSAGASCSCTGWLATSTILSINSCLRNFSTSTTTNTFAISRNSDTNLEFNSVLYINSYIVFFSDFFILSILNMFTSFYFNTLPIENNIIFEKFLLRQRTK